MSLKIILLAVCHLDVDEMKGPFGKFEKGE
jgi:hypothetical protein